MTDTTQAPVVLNLAEALALANEAAEMATVDMSEVSTGGGERRVLPAGFAFARLVEYVELGEHVQIFEGKPKPAAMQFRLGFAIWGDTDPQNPAPQSDRPDTLFHYFDKDGNQKPGIFRTFDMSLGNNEKARTKLAFDKMNWQKKPGVKSFGQFLGQAFLLPIKQTNLTKGKNAGKMRNDIDWANIMAPLDPISRQPYPVPETPMDLVRYFFWDKPTPATWEALKIGDGSLNEKGESKDFIRDMMKKAVNFEGSALHIMLGGAASAVNSLPVPDLGAQAAQQPPAVPTVDVAQAAPIQPPAVPVAVPQVAAQVAAADVPFEGGQPASPELAAVSPAAAMALPALPNVPSL